MQTSANFAIHCTARAFSKKVKAFRKSPLPPPKNSPLLKSLSIKAPSLKNTFCCVIIARMKRVLVIANTKKDASRALSQEVKSFLEQHSYEATIYNFDGTPNTSPFLGYDLVVSLGGDGTVLFAARGSVKNLIPVFPINLGQFGFIASVQPTEWKAELTKVIEGNATYEERMMTTSAIVASKYSNTFSSISLNDTVIKSCDATRLVSFEVFYNDTTLGLFKADGLIIATPTGSTAYNASAGGPIVEPDVDALILTPINSFSLSARPVILSSRGEVGVRVISDNAVITSDGMTPSVLREGDFIKVRKLNEKVRLIACNAKKFYGALRSKFNWSGGPHINA